MLTTIIQPNPFSERFQSELNGIEKRQKLILENPETSSAKREEQINKLFHLLQEDQQKKLIQQLDVSEIDLSMTELLSLVSQLPYLKRLKISAKRLWRKEELNSKQFNELLKRCTRLASLTLKHSTLPSKAFEALKQCSQLEEVNLKYSREIDGRIFIYLAQVSSLKKINLAHSPKVDDQSLSEIDQDGLSWEELNVSNCPGEFSQETLEKISHLSPNFKLINEAEDW